MWRILCPYLINIRKLAKEDASTILKEWLRRCDGVRKLDFNSQREVSSRLRSVGPYLPLKKN
jgi:hypothetical protein